ncbi:MAG TPA: ABC transporter permease subunit [Planctomycetes bacterium]|jgi:tungstate transport system permease protein|nr:ABC transporter permease subunit [Planctomycetaceae bacterium]HIN53752.1 ABC transporter permease subunit [Planctomycetota bacterium]
MEFIWNGIVEALKLILAGDPQVLDAAWRSIWISTTAVALAAVVGIAIGCLLARANFRGRTLLIILFRAGMGIPTVLIGLVGYALLSRQGPLGMLELLYTPVGIVLGEFALALPIIVSLTHAAIANLDPRVHETAVMLGASPWQRLKTYLGEARLAITLALLTAFARCFTELGIAIMIGGNIKFITRTLATATTLETARGNLSRAVAMSLVLLLMAIVMTTVISLLSTPRSQEKRA